MSCCGGQRAQLRTEFSARGAQSPLPTSGRVVFEYILIPFNLSDQPIA